MIEWDSACHHMVKGCPEAVYVSPSINIYFAPYLFGRYIIRGSPDKVFMITNSNWHKSAK